MGFADTGTLISMHVLLGSRILLLWIDRKGAEQYGGTRFGLRQVAHPISVLRVSLLRFVDSTYS
jgi:hypothetical protein